MPARAALLHGTWSSALSFVLCARETQLFCASFSSVTTRNHNWAVTLSDMANTALVTGGTGYLGSELVKQLLQKGFDVHATVRKPDNKSAVQHLLKLADALPGNLKLFKADLLEPNAFDEAIQGCQYIFHTA